MNMILRTDGNICMKMEDQSNFSEESLIEELKKSKKEMI